MVLLRFYWLLSRRIDTLARRMRQVSDGAIYVRDLQLSMLRRGMMGVRLGVGAPDFLGRHNKPSPLTVRLVVQSPQRAAT